MAIWGNAARIHRSLSSGSCESWVTKWRTRSGGPKRVKTPGGPTRNRVLRGIELYTIGQYWTIYILYNYIQYIIYNYIQLDNLGYVTYVYICHQRPNDTPWCVWKLSIPPWNTNVEGENGNKSARFGASIVIDVDGSAMVSSPLDLLWDSLGVSILQRSS